MPVSGRRLWGGLTRAHSWGSTNTAPGRLQVLTFSCRHPDEAEGIAGAVLNLGESSRVHSRGRTGPRLGTSKHPTPSTGYRTAGQKGNYVRAMVCKPKPSCVPLLPQSLGSALKKSLAQEVTCQDQREQR